MPIEVKKLCKAFGEKQVLDQLSHVFPDGRITCITGPSGCGKTTLLRILMGLTPADSGEVLGLDRHDVAAVFQEDRLIEHLSPVDNARIVLPRDYPRRKIADALEAAGLGDALCQPVRTLSGGMKRRTALVRALLHPASIVLMDEPFKGLDPDTRRLVLDFTRSQLQNRTALIVTHDPQSIEALRALHFPLQA